LVPFFRKSASAPVIAQQPRLPAGLRVYAVGDVHGRLDLLDEAFCRIDCMEMDRPSERNLTILLGDMIDRGPDSQGVVSRVLARSKRHWLLAMRGNHEQMLLDFLSDPGTLEPWGPLGAFNTLLSYGLKPSRAPTPEQRRQLAQDLRAAMPPGHLDFFQNLPISFSCHGYFFAHAGIRPGVALDRQSPEDLLWIRDEFLSHRGPFERVVVHGHTPVVAPELLPHRINVDTGAYATGRLTCAVLEGDEVVFL
jgi:serine/threonine protein phosphatase 1